MRSNAFALPAAMSSSSKPDLRIDWATYEAAKYACEHWHYSGCMPAGKLVKVGAWERGSFVGCVVFGLGANNNLPKAFNLEVTQICELVRVALTGHSAPVSKVLALAVKFLKNQSPGVRLVVSYADPAQGHHGGIYQACNWIFDGTQQGQTEYLWKGKQTHGRSVMADRGTVKGLKKIRVPGKHRYLMPLDDEMRAKILPLAQPYPKRPKQATPATSGEAAGQNRPGRSNLSAAGTDEPA